MVAFLFIVPFLLFLIYSSPITPSYTSSFYSSHHLRLLSLLQQAFPSLPSPVLPLHHIHPFPSLPLTPTSCTPITGVYIVKPLRKRMRRKSLLINSFSLFSTRHLHYKSCSSALPLASPNTSVSFIFLLIFIFCGNYRLSGIVWT